MTNSTTVEKRLDERVNSIVNTTYADFDDYSVMMLHKDSDRKNKCEIFFYGEANSKSRKVKELLDADQNSTKKLYDIHKGSSRVLKSMDDLTSFLEMNEKSLISNGNDYWLGVDGSNFYIRDDFDSRLVIHTGLLDTSLMLREAVTVNVDTADYLIKKFSGKHFELDDLLDLSKKDRQIRTLRNNYTGVASVYAIRQQ